MTGSMERRALWILLGGAITLSGLRAEMPPTLELTLKDHRFAPAEVHVKAGQAVFLVVANQDGEPEEFELLQLAIEKVIPAGAKGRIRLRPLGPGRYAFIGEFHKSSAQGAVISE